MSELTKKDLWTSLLREEMEKESIHDFNIPVLKKVKSYVEDSGGTILLVDNPNFPGLNLSKNEKQIKLTVWGDKKVKILRKNPSFLGNGYFKKINSNYAREIFIGPGNRLKKQYWVNDDYETDLIRVKAGYRQGVKKKYSKDCLTVYLFGSSVAYSNGCEESQTLSSFLENQLDNPGIKVANRGVRGGNLINSAFAILDTPISHGDIVILYGFKPITREERVVVMKEFRCLDLRNIFARPHSYGDVFYDDEAHLTPAGNLAVAKFLAGAIQDEHFNKKVSIKSTFSDFEKTIFNKLKHCRLKSTIRFIHESFPAYIELLESERRAGYNGIAVMNCNPFTLGHQHLISTASKVVDNLYVFVLEEDKSTFPFKQRFEMVKEGVKHIDNVVVVPTGKFVVSTMTFPEYFTKEDGFDASMNIDFDLEIFVEYIVPVLNLRKRFIGTEPSCQTTRTQHEIMKDSLPLNGVFVTEIERKRNQYGAISASKVREIIKTKDFAKLSSFLPHTTKKLLTEYGYIK